MGGSARQGGSMAFRGPVPYYDGLSGWYAAHPVNLNIADRQAPDAPNQRLFDCPAAGGFLLTDGGAQAAELFEPDELALYAGPEDVLERARYWLEHPAERAALTARARRRVLAEHIYEHRLRSLVRILRKRYA